jgi:hypothetical protein
MVEKRGIGGWLILPAISVALNPLLILSKIVQLIELQSDFSYRLAIQAMPVLSAVVTLDLLGSLALFIFSIVLAIKFFKKREGVPSLVVWFLVLNTLLQLMLLALSTGAWETYPQLTFDYGSRAVTWIVSSLIWGAYFKLSKRVKATFVN